MKFQNKLNIILGERIILHTMECSVCQHNEYYYIHPVTRKQLGRACENCNSVQRFDD
jgi:hypothetical protein